MKLFSELFCIVVPPFVVSNSDVYGGIQIRPDTEEPEDVDEDVFF